jgi:hypothetical protein
VQRRRIGVDLGWELDRVLAPALFLEVDDCRISRFRTVAERGRLRPEIEPIDGVGWHEKHPSRRALGRIGPDASAQNPRAEEADECLR